jgi:hypothetical protein
LEGLSVKALQAFIFPQSLAKLHLIAIPSRTPQGVAGTPLMATPKNTYDIGGMPSIEPIMTFFLRHPLLKIA